VRSKCRQSRIRNRQIGVDAYNRAAIKHTPKLFWGNCMTFRTILCVALLTLTASAQPGHAQNLTGKMGEASFNLFVPQGYCEPTRSSSGERVFADYIDKAMENAGSQVMRIVASCAELKARQENSSANIFDYVVYYFPRSVENTTLNGDRAANRKTECDDLRKQTDEAIKDVPEISERTAREMKVKGSVKNIQYLGVLDEDPHGCYGGLLSRNVDGAGHVYVVYVVVVRTVLHGKDFWVGVYSQYGSAAANLRTLQLAKTTAAQLDQKNPE
jgi:hypothetical protein